MPNPVTLAFALDTGQFDPTVNNSMVLSQAVKAGVVSSS